MTHLIRNWWENLRGHGQMRCTAWKLIHGGNFDAAAAVIEQGSQRFSKSFSFTILRARYLLLSDERDQAAEVIEKGLGWNPRDAFDQFELAETYRMLGRYRESIQWFDRLSHSGPLNLPLLSCQRLASLYDRIGEPENALQATVRCIQRGGAQQQSLTVQIARKCDADSVQAALVDVNRLRAPNSRCDVGRLKLVASLAASLDHWEHAIESISRAVKLRYEAAGWEGHWDDSKTPLKPSVIIIGAMKSGTTALFTQLLAHPQMVAPLDKELQFFHRPDWPEEFYFAHFPRVESPSRPLVTGEASPGYYIFDIVDRVKRMLPETKIVFIRRNPAERAISHFFHNQTNSIGQPCAEELHAGMNEVLDLCTLDDRSLGVRLRDFQSGRRSINHYLLMGCYDLLTSRWKNSFSAERYLELDFDAFVSSSQQTMDRLFEFIGLDPFQIDASPSSNVGRYKGDSAKFEAIRSRLEEFYVRVDNLS